MGPVVQGCSFQWVIQKVCSHLLVHCVTALQLHYKGPNGVLPTKLLRNRILSALLYLWHSETREYFIHVLRLQPDTFQYCINLHME